MSTPVAQKHSMESSTGDLAFAFVSLVQDTNYGSGFELRRLPGNHNKLES